MAPRAVLLLLVLLVAMAPLCVQAAPVQAAPMQAALEAVEVRSADSHRRVRRQNGEVVESIFQIPITTLQAVSKALTTGIQTFQRGREQFYQASRPTAGGGGGGLNAAYNYQQTNALSSINYQQSSKPSAAYSPYKPAYNAYKPAYNTAAFSQAQAYAVLNRPGYVLYNYTRPRGAGAASAAGQSHAASVAGVAPQSDGTSYRI